MAKILLVEDDNNLREIYAARLGAEGYEIVSAADGEQALAIAVKEKPDLIIADVMMPKVSGFDMLDILRNAPETKDTKVIMMTALSQAEDKERADKLGADLYLVKSQVTLEDVAASVHKMLEGPQQPPSGAPAQPPNPPSPPVETPAAPPPPSDQATSKPPEPVAAPQPAVQSPPPPVAPAPAPPEQTTPAPPKKIEVKTDKPPERAPIGPNLAEALADEEKSIPNQIESFEEAPAETTAAPVATNQADPVIIKPEAPSAQASPAQTNQPSPDNSSAENPNKKVIQPINDPTKGPDLNSLLAKENEKEETNPSDQDTKPPTDGTDDLGKIAL